MLAFRLRSTMRPRLLAAACGAVVLLLSACGGPRRPSIVLIVWDTVRADRLGLYGYAKPTTPFLDEWAKGARVYEDCQSPANYTVASHASLFTGLFPTEHGARNGDPVLPEKWTTLAEALKGVGYRTFLYSANPHIAGETHFTQGFDVAEHPWDENLIPEAVRIVRSKVPPEERGILLAEKLRTGRLQSWDIKATGELAGKRLLRWLAGTDRKKPFFVFLNYMEAHGPWIAPEKYERLFLTEDQLGRSRIMDRSFTAQWGYSFGLREYSADEIAILSGKYEATIAELDGLFRDLMASLQEGGYLENTVVVLTSDHGDHLGDHRLLGHQYSLYQSLIHVPLVIRAPGLFPPGRESRPVMTQDLFRTLLRIGGAPVPTPVAGRGADLLEPAASRARLSECPGVFAEPFADVLARDPGWDPGPWRREIRALSRGGDKLIRWSDGETRLYRIAEDPVEEDDRASRDAETVRALGGILDGVVSSLVPASPSTEPAPVLPAEQREMLRALGYLNGGADSNETGRE